MQIKRSKFELICSRECQTIRDLARIVSRVSFVAALEFLRGFLVSNSLFEACEVLRVIKGEWSLNKNLEIVDDSLQRIRNMTSSN